MSLIFLNRQIAFALSHNLPRAFLSQGRGAGWWDGEGGPAPPAWLRAADVSQRPPARRAGDAASGVTPARGAAAERAAGVGGCDCRESAPSVSAAVGRPADPHA